MFIVLSTIQLYLEQKRIMGSSQIPGVTQENL